MTEGRLIRIVGAEAQDDIAIWLHHEGVPAHWHGWKSFVTNIIIGGLLRPDYGLECVAVQMEGVFARVHVVEDYLNDLVFLENEGVGIFTIDARVASRHTCGESAVKGGDFRANVGYVVEEGTCRRSVEQTVEALGLTS